MWKFITYAMVAFIFIVFSGIDACAGTLTNPERAVSLLRNMGYTNIKVMNRDVWFVYFKGGAGGDNAIYTIQVTSSTGENVVVQVYEGWPFKAATLRGR